MPELEIALLGSPRVSVAGAPVAMDTRKAVALLAYLAVTGRAHGRDHLAALLWPESDQTRARAALRRTLSTLNGALDPGRLVVTREAIGLRQSSDLAIDVAQFRAALAQAQADPQGRSGHRLEADVALYRDDFMAGFHLRDSPEFDDWRYLESEQLRRDLAWALDRLTAVYGERGDFEQAIAFAHRRLALDLLHEDGHRQLMLLYARAGRTTAALRQYRDCVRILDSELGVEPLDATTALYQAIRERKEPAALPGMPAPAAVLGASDNGAPRAARSSPPPAYPLVGREPELALLGAAFEEYAPGGRLIIVEGEAGVGKTRVVQAFLERVGEQGGGVLTLRCYEGEALLTYGPIIDALKPVLLEPRGAPAAAALSAQTLSEVSRFFPELLAGRADVSPPAPLDSPGARTRFYDALLDALQQVLGGSRGGVLFIDDVQWIDGATLDLLAYLIHRLAGRPLLVLAWRGDQVADYHRLRVLLADATQAGNATLVALGRLSRQDVESLARVAVGGDSGSLGERLYRETDGLPFFVVQYLDELRQRRGEPDSDRWRLPGGVRDLLHARLAALDAEERQVLTTLAAIGAAAPFEVVLGASGRSEDEVVTALDQLRGRGLVSELDDGALPRRTPLYEISHDRLRDLLYMETSPLRRRLLHRRIAEALRPRGNAPSQRAEPARAAYHLRLAGLDADAADAYRAAGDGAAELFANSEAVGHYDAALALGYPNTALLHERIGDLQMRMGAYEFARAAYEKAAALRAPEDSGAVEHKLGNLHHRLGEWSLAERHYAAAEPLLVNGARADPGEPAQLLVDWGLAAHRQGNREQAQRLGRRALELAGQAAATRALAQSHNLLGILARGAGDPRARSHLEESLRLARSLEDPELCVAALNNLALLEHAAGNHAPALSLGREALALAVLQGDRHHEAALHSNLADFLQAMGQTDDALAHLRQSAVIYAEIGVVAGERQAEIWKLTEW